MSSSLAAGAVSGDLSALAGDPEAAIPKSQLTVAERKVAGGIRSLVRRISSLGGDRAAVLRARPDTLSNSFQRVSAGGMIQCYVEPAGDLAAAAEAVRAAGGRIELVSAPMRVVQCEVPYDRILALAGSDAVDHVRLPAYAMTRTGSVLSQGDGVHRCNLVRSTYGYNGSGRKVGVISDGIKDISLSVASGDIPASYQAQSARSDNNLYVGAEGLAMMEIVYDLAPGAALAFSNPGTSAEMVSAINILDSTFGCDVICDDIGFADEPFFEDGPIVARINQAVTNGGLYVSAGGNAAYKNYYEGSYTGMTYSIGGNSRNVQAFATDDWHIRASVPGNGGFITVVLQWNDSWGASGNDYDLYITDSTGATVYASSTILQNGNDKPVEYAGVVNNGTSAAYCYIVVNKDSGSDRFLKITSWGSGTFTEHYQEAGSIWGHPAGDNAICCGAVRYSTPGTVEYFSSRGPVRIDFPSLVYRAKPDVCGVDGVSVTANGGFVTPFYGTSAAAPHVAAICAQVWSANPALSNTAVRNLVQNNAVDIGEAGYDYNSGYGRADALNAVEAIDVTAPTVSGTSPARGACVPSLPSVQVTFSESVTGAAAANLTVNGSVATSVAGSGAGPYTFSGYAAPADGTVGVVLAAGAIEDAAGNPFAGDGWTYTKSSVAPAVLAKASCKSHGTTGEFCFDLPDPSPGPVAVECRDGGATTVVVDFDRAVQAADGSLEAGDEVTASNGSIDSLDVAGSRLTIGLSGTTNTSCLAVTVRDLCPVPCGPSMAAATLYVRVLAGDVTADGQVTSADLLAVRSQLTQPVTSATARHDLDASGGTINSTDLLSVRSHLQAQAASCP